MDRKCLTRRVNHAKLLLMLRKRLRNRLRQAFFQEVENRYDARCGAARGGFRHNCLSCDQ